MVRDYNVISKGKYEYKQTNEFLQINRFLIVRKKKRRMLLLDMENVSEETLTAVKLQIEQFDVRGKDLGPTTFETKTSYKKGGFILKKAIELHHSCIDFRVKVVYAEYGNYVYRLGEEDTYVTYEKKKKRKKLSDATVRKKTGKEGHLTKKRRFKAPIFVGVFATLILALAAATTFVHLQSYKQEKEQFFLQNLKYEFIDGNKAEGAPVYITGYIGLGGEDILIPNAVEGHPVQGIAQGAFANNEIIETLTVEKGVVVSMDAFYNCNSLKSVTLLGENVIEDYAFAECDGLEKIKATDLIYAGNGAFSNATELKSLRFESGAKEVTVNLGEKVVTGAEEMDEIYIDAYIAYGEKCNYFDRIESVESLYLKNLNQGAHSLDGALDKTLGDIFGERGVAVKKVEIQYADVIPAYLTEKCGTELTEFAVHSLTETTVGESAFKDCSQLVSINLPKLITEVGESAFEGTAITSFNALALKKMGPAAFKNCIELSDFQLDVISELNAIPREAFSGCEALTIMYVPAKVEKIGEKAFYECKELETFNFAMDGVLTEIDDNAFELCKKLTTLSLPAKLEKIGSQAFKTCNRLNYLSIPQSVEKIEMDAFEECYRLYEIENLSYTLEILPGIGLGEYSLMVYTSASDARMPRKTVGDYVFGEVDSTWYLLWYLGSDSELTLPTAAGIGDYVVQSYLFIDTEGITQINIPNQAAVVGKKVFHESDISKVFFMEGSAELTFTADTFSGCESLVEVDFNARIFESIDSGLFEACSKLSKIGLPKYLTKIGAFAFAGCENLVSITGGQGVQLIEESAFNSCSSLENFAFSSNLETIGAYAFAGCDQLTAFTGATSLVNIGTSAFEGCSSLTTAGLPETLTTIGEYAFKNCSSLLSVNIPTKVALLKQETFQGCSSLASVSTCSGVLALESGVFSDCTSLGSISMPALSTMGMEAFKGCSSLRSVSLPVLSTMGNRAFANCVSLGEVTISNNMSSIPEYAFAESGVTGIAGGKNLTSIGDYAFYNCDRLTSLNVPVNVQTIGMEAFYDCDGLQRLTLNSLLKYIENYAFIYCDALTAVALNDNLQFVGANAFAYCSALQSVTVGNNVSQVGNGAFQECKALQKVTIGDDVDTLSSSVFKDCTSLTTVTVGTSLNSIGEEAFSGCTLLGNLSLGDGLENIGTAAFMNCTELTSVVLPDSVLYLGPSAFENCTGLTEVRLSDALNQVSAYAFNGCKQLSKVHLGEKLSWIGNDAFYGCDQLHEIYNFSQLSLIINSTDYGYVAYNALVIHTSENASMSTISIGNYLFKNWGNTWALISYTGKDSSLYLGEMSYFGGTIQSYEIARYAFKDCSALQELAIGPEVAAIRSQAFNGMTGLKKVDLQDVNNSLVIPSGAFNDTNALETLIVPTQLAYMESGAFSQYSYSNFFAYFEGAQSQWEYSKYNINSRYWYYYDRCIHYEREWNYDKNGQINTMIQAFKEKTMKESTCLESGEKLYYCDNCDDTKTVYPSSLGHNMSDYECTRCGYIDELPVNRNTLAHFREVVTITNKSENPFDLFDTVSTEIHAPNVYSITSEMTFTAKKAIRLSFIAVASGDCKFVIENNSLTQAVDGGSIFTFELKKGDTLIFKYTDYRVVIEDGSELPGDSSGDDSSNIEAGESNDFVNNYAEEDEPYASAYINKIYVSSLDEKNPV